jgi:hypothetical protein
MPRKKTTIDFEKFAKMYAVTSRTCRNWHAAGADLLNPESVADLILKQHTSSPEAIKAILKNAN